MKSTLIIPAIFFKFDKNKRMEKYALLSDLVVFGIEVKTFPEGIGASFNQLSNIHGNDRNYYGISWFDKNGRIKYYAMTPELFTNELQQPSYETLTLRHGNYLTRTIFDWQSKTSTMKEVFHELMKDSRPGKDHPCIEWDKSDTEMVCMIKQ
jgi:hypothetical protein